MRRLSVFHLRETLFLSLLTALILGTASRPSAKETSAPGGQKDSKEIEQCARMSLEVAAKLVDSTLNGEEKAELLKKLRKACEGVNLRALGGNCAQTARDLDQYVECVSNIAFASAASLSAAVTCGPLSNFQCCEYSCTNSRTGVAVGTVRWCRTPPNCPAVNTYSNCTCTRLASLATPCDPHTCNTVGTLCD